MALDSIEHDSLPLATWARLTIMAEYRRRMGKRYKPIEQAFNPQPRVVQPRRDIQLLEINERARKAREARESAANKSASETKMVVDR